MKRLLALVLFSLLGCLDAPTARDNPLDADGVGVAVIEGIPDTIDSRLAVYVLRLRTEPALPPTVSVEWSADGLQVFLPSTVTPVDASYIAIRRTIRAQFGPASNPRIVKRDVMVRQRPKFLELACDPPCAAEALEVRLGVRPEVRDSLGSLVSGISADNAVVMQSRDTNVISVQGSVVRARGNGVAWVVGTFPGIPMLQDSLLISVAQLLQYGQATCPAFTMYVGASAQMAITGLFDRNDQPYRFAAPAIEWLEGDNGGSAPSSDPPAASVAPGGLVTALRPGYWQTEAVVRANRQVLVACSWYVIEPPAIDPP